MTAFKEKNHSQRVSTKFKPSAPTIDRKPDSSHSHEKKLAAKLVRNPNIVLSPITTNTKQVANSTKSVSYNSRFFMNEEAAKQYRNKMNAYSGPCDTYYKYLCQTNNNGPVDTIGEMQYLRDNEGPIDARDEIDFHNRNQGPVDTKGEGLRINKNAGPVDSIGEGLYLNENAGPPDSKGELDRDNMNPGPIDTKGEGLRINNNNGPVDALGETDYKGKRQTINLQKLPDPPANDQEETNSYIPSIVPRM